MATNPRIPDERDLREPRSGPTVLQSKPKAGSVWGMVAAALAVAIVLLGVTIYKMSQAPKATAPAARATVPAQPVNAALQIQGIQMALSPDGNAGILQGTVTNTSNQVVNGVQVAVDFIGQDGTVVDSQEGPMEVLQLQGKGQDAKVTNQQGMAAAPLKPNDSRPFRVQINRVPQGWNHQAPGVRILTMTSTTS